jgi:hypothetical protein
VLGAEGSKSKRRSTIMTNTAIILMPSSEEEKNEVKKTLTSVAHKKQN